MTGLCCTTPVTSSCSAISGATSNTTPSSRGHRPLAGSDIVTAYSGSTTSSPTSLAGNCNRGEIVAPVTQTLSPTSQIAGCSPISAVADAFKRPSGSARTRSPHAGTPIR